MYDRSSLQVPSLFGWVVGLGLTIPVLFASESYPAYLGFLICFSVFIFLFGGVSFCNLLFLFNEVILVYSRDGYPMTR